LFKVYAEKPLNDNGQQFTVRPGNGSGNGCGGGGCPRSGRGGCTLLTERWEKLVGIDQLTPLSTNPFQALTAVGPAAID